MMLGSINGDDNIAVRQEQWQDIIMSGVRSCIQNVALAALVGLSALSGLVSLSGIGVAIFTSVLIVVSIFFPPILAGTSVLVFVVALQIASVIGILFGTGALTLRECSDRYYKAIET